MPLQRYSCVMFHGEGNFEGCMVSGLAVYTIGIQIFGQYFKQWLYELVKVQNFHNNVHKALWVKGRKTYTKSTIVGLLSQHKLEETTFELVAIPNLKKKMSKKSYNIINFLAQI